MPPQITCATLYDRPSIRIILDSASASIVVVIVGIVIVVLPTSIIPVSSRCGTCTIGVPVTALRGSLLCKKHL